MCMHGLKPTSPFEVVVIASGLSSGAGDTLMIRVLELSVILDISTVVTTKLCPALYTKASFIDTW